MAIYPWLVSHEKQGQGLEDYPDLKRWYEVMEARPAVRRPSMSARSYAARWTIWMKDPQDAVRWWSGERR